MYLQNIKMAHLRSVPVNISYFSNVLYQFLFSIGFHKLRPSILLKERHSYQEQRHFNHRDHKVHGGKQSFHQLNSLSFF